jgi:hypothetical protein
MMNATSVSYGCTRMLKMVKREEQTTGNTSREFMYDGSF